jgi:hypothetical protein
MSLTACAADRIPHTDQHTDGRLERAPISPATERAAVTPDTATLAAQARDDGEPLTTYVRLREGTIFVEPPMRPLAVGIDVHAAHAAALAQPGATLPALLTCRVGVLTDTELTDTAGNLLYDQVLVWMCFWVNVIVGPSATPREHENIITFVDATTGQTLFTTGDAV